MFIFSFIGLLITASLAGLLWYKISNDDNEDDVDLSSFPDDWEDYKAQYDAPDEHNTHPQA